MSADAKQADRFPGISPVLALGGLLVVQVLVGYEWFISGLTKVVDGGFPSGLAGELKDKSKDAAHWYKSFLDGTVIPNAKTFGVLIEIGELVVGAALIAAAIFWFFRWAQLSERGRVTILAVTVLASLGSVFMAINFHLASGASHPWLIPQTGFDETVDLDSLLVLTQLVLIGVSVRLLWTLRREQQAGGRQEARKPPTRSAASGTPVA